MTLSGNGVLRRVTDAIRKYVDDPSDTAKFSDDDLLRYVQKAFAEIVAELNRNSAMKIRARVDITITQNTVEYALPPNVNRYLSFEKISDSDTEVVEWEVIPRHPLSPAGAGFMIEGPMLRITPVWKTGYTMRLTYEPSYDISCFEGTIDDSTDTTTTFDISSVTDGTQDARAYAYVAYVARLLDGSGNTTAERVITDYDGTTLTVAPALSSAPGAATVEVVPQHFYRLENLTAMRVAKMIASLVGDTERARLLNQEYQESLRSLRLDTSQADGRVGNRMTRVIRGHRRRRPSWGRFTI